MAHYAKVEDGIVTQVIVAEQDFIDSGVAGDPSTWIQTSYNTRNGVHVLGGTPLRKNYAGIGYIYDADLDAFLPPKPHPRWVVDEATGTWVAPTPRPDDENSYMWDDKTDAWVQIESVTPLRP
jgi:hypothetical protein